MEKEKAVRVSVIVPTYNHGRYLPEALKSVEATGFKDLEIIVIDDGSTDPDSLAVYDKLRKDGYRIIRQENAGVAASRNHGIRLARGEYILPLYADNRLLGPYLQEGLAVLDAHPEIGVVYGDARIFGEKGGTWVNHPLKLSEILFENYIDNCAIFRKKAWESVQGYDEQAPFHTREDWFFWLDLLGAGWKFHYINQFCFEYRFLNNSKVRKKSATLTNKRIIAQYIFPRQRDLIRQFVESGELPREDARNMIRQLNQQLAYYHFKSGSIAEGYLFWWNALGAGLGLKETLKLGLGWPVFRWVRK